MNSFDCLFFFLGMVSSMEAAFARAPCQRLPVGDILSITHLFKFGQRGFR